MKTMYRALCFSLLLTLAASHSEAAVFVGSSKDITDFAGGSEVSNRGTLVDAINLINDENAISSTTINGVTFKGIAPGQLHEGGETFAEASFVYNYYGAGYEDSGLWTSGGAYDTLADSQLYGTDDFEKNGDDGYGVVNLTPGVLYELQIFMLDDRAGVNKNSPLQVTQVAWTGVNNDLDTNVLPVELGYFEGITIGGNGITQANGEIATLLIQIDEGFNGLTVNTWNNGAFNGMQLRTLDNLPGDLDHDNDVDGRDFLEWQRGFGNPYTEADLSDIQAFYGADLSAPATASISAVPEPTTAFLTAAVVVLLPMRLRRRGYRVG